jgi:hypothetical protein
VSVLMIDLLITVDAYEQMAPEMLAAIKQTYRGRLAEHPECPPGAAIIPCGPTPQRICWDEHNRRVYFDQHPSDRRRPDAYRYQWRAVPTVQR